MASRKRAPPAHSEIIREQIQLLAAEKELMATLENIKEQINRLQVEELELKSALANSRAPRSNIPTPKVEPKTLTEQFDAVHVINEQKLDLFTGTRSQTMEEHDDE